MNPPRRQASQRIANMLQDFFRLEAAGGIMLVFFALVAIVLANSPYYDIYDNILNHSKFRFGFDSLDYSYDFEIRKSVLIWINDGLMAIFFFVIGLEIKREFVAGELSSRARALFPFMGAVGGMALPALIYWLLNMDTPENLRGWAIPAATDIAFSLGVLSLLGTRIPVSLKILLTAIAVIDDLGAILIIAIFYTEELAFTPLYFALGAMAVLFFFNRICLTRTAPYVLIGFVLWFAVLQSGVHATLAGVATAMFVPMRCRRDPAFSPCEDLAHDLHPWVAFGILPIFAFANAGVPFHDIGLHSFTEPVALGIILGLFIGKQLGIFAALWATVKLGISPMPEGTSWMQIYGVAILCGIGFTMSLFIGELAFHSMDKQAAIRLGVLAGSLLSAVVGYMVLRQSSGKSP